MKLPFRLLALPAVISVLTLQLSGCGEGGNTLPDPVAERVNTITTCEGEKEVCTKGQFVDEPVVGLNYSCNQVQGITNEEGVFSCPNNSVVTFYLQAEKGKKRINIGVYLIKALGTLTGSRVTDTFLQITPNDLVDKKSPSASLQITNILRLLQVMDSDNSYEADALNRIVITNADKNLIDLLDSDIVVSAFADTDKFEKKIEVLLAKLNRTLPSKEVATARFNRSLMVLQSGIYEVAPLVLNYPDVLGGRHYSGMVGGSPLTSKKAFESLFFVIDRDSKTIGLGMEWLKDVDLSTLDNILLQKVFFDTLPKPLHFTSSNMGFDTTGKIKSDFKLTTESGDNTIEITQGVMEKGNLVGNNFFYRNIYGLASTEAVSTDSLGKWRRSGSPVLEGELTMSKTRPVAPFLDGEIWKTQENSAKPIFPLHLKLTFNNNDLVSCKDVGCVVGTLGISILESGNIITDLNNNCRAVKDMMEVEDANSGVDPLLEEHRLGTIAATFSSATTGAAISPLILVDDWAKDDPKWGGFYGIYTGMSSGVAGGPKVQINIANVRSKSVTMQNQRDEKDTKTTVQPAAWTNYIKFLTVLSTAPDKRTASDVSAMQGYISKVEVQDCNTFLK